MIKPKLAKSLAFNKAEGWSLSIALDVIDVSALFALCFVDQPMSDPANLIILFVSFLFGCWQGLSFPHDVMEKKETHFPGKKSVTGTIL